MIQALTQKKIKTKQAQRPGDRGQQDAESGKKNVSLILAALEIIKKELAQNLQLFPGHPLATELQITLMSTAHIIRKVLG